MIDILHSEKKGGAAAQDGEDLKTRENLVAVISRVYTRISLMLFKTAVQDRRPNLGGPVPKRWPQDYQETWG